MRVKRNKIMKFRKFISFSKIEESLKEIRLNNILDKISNKIKISEIEQDFLDNYSNMNDEDIMDFKMLSKESTFTRISQLIDENRKVICNLIDRNGPIGIEIRSIFNNYDDDKSIITLKNNEKVLLKDNMLYNILYNTKKDEYSLEIEDEFYEKITKEI